jgi:hypothetical protein
MVEKKAGLPRPCGPRNDEPQRIVPGKNRKVQIARTGKRKLFDRARRKVFLEWFAATANVKMSAEKAGVSYKTVFKHRMKDADFAQDWNRALAQGYARVEAKVLETRGPGGGGGPIAIDGDLDAPELDEVDPQAVQLLREHRRGLAEGKGAGQSRKQGRRPRVASNAEVRAALLKRLKAFGIRVSGENGGAGSGD